LRGWGGREGERRKEKGQGANNLLLITSSPSSNLNDCCLSFFYFFRLLFRVAAALCLKNKEAFVSGVGEFLIWEDRTRKQQQQQQPSGVGEFFISEDEFFPFFHKAEEPRRARVWRRLEPKKSFFI
jgi:hypothetical protein